MQDITQNARGAAQFDRLGADLALHLAPDGDFCAVIWPRKVAPSLTVRERALTSPSMMPST